MSITTDVERVIAQNKEQFDKVSGTTKLYRKMLQDGIIVPRGNQLLPIEDMHRQRPQFNKNAE